MPETSIIIRTFNEEKHLGDLLRAIGQQEYQDYEIVSVDSGSTDKTLDIAGAFKVKILQIDSHDFTFGYSLNLGCKHAQGRYLVLVSAHVLPVDNHWLGNLIAPLKKDGKIAMVHGRQLAAQSSKFSEGRDLQKLCCPHNANSALRKDLWQERPFDEYLFGLEDVEWARYITQKGYAVHYEPKAAVYHIHEEKWHQIFNRYRREAIAAVRIGLKHPLQVRTDIFWLINNLFQDFLASLPNVSPARLEEIIRFRYYQWKGTRQGWYHDKNIDLDRDKYTLFYPAGNQAVVIKSKHQAQIEDISIPEMKPGDILVQVDYVGVCRTDLEVYEGTLGYYRKGLAHYPIVPGHEWSGTIVRIGASNEYREHFKVGGKVVGECVLSRSGDALRQEVGVINYNGAYAQFIVIPGQYLHQIPEDLDLKTACLAEPLAVVLRAIRRVKPRLSPGQQVAVIGAGSIGNLCSQVLLKEGYQVTVFDKNQEKLEFLKNKAKAISQKLSGLDKFDLIVEATGDVNVLKIILQDSRRDATLLLLGFPYGNLNYNFEDLVGQEKVIITSVGGESEDFDKALVTLPQLETAPFVQNIILLEDFAQAWELQRQSEKLKVILKNSKI